MQAGKPGGRLKEGEPPPQTKPAVIPLTSQQIQQLLEDNAVILKAIQEAQNLGRVEECEKYQRLVHKNLTCLAALADAQQRFRAAQANEGMAPQAQVQAHARPPHGPPDTNRPPQGKWPML